MRQAYDYWQDQPGSCPCKTGRLAAPLTSALPGAACFGCSRRQAEKLATRPVGARPVPRAHPHQAGNSLSSKPTRGSPRGYQPAIRKTRRPRPLGRGRALSAGCPVTRAAGRRPRPLRGAPGGQGHRSIPSEFTVCASRIRTSQPSSRAPGLEDRDPLPLSPLPVSALTDSRPVGAASAPLSCGLRGAADSGARRRAGAHYHSSDYWARRTQPEVTPSWAGAHPPWGLCAGTGRREGPGLQPARGGGLSASPLACCTPFFLTRGRVHFSAGWLSRVADVRGVPGVRSPLSAKP